MYIKEPFNSDKCFWTSDAHYLHKAIIWMEHRPFKDVEEMNQTLVDNWNAVVSDDSTVFFTGDVSYKGSQKALVHILNSLRGKIHLILGNHDKPNILSRSGRFETISDILDIKVKDGDSLQSITNIHYPMISWRNSSRGSWCCSGHTHSTLVSGHPNMVNVCVENWDYSPISYYQLKEYITQKLKTII